MIPDPLWYKDAVIYELNVRSFHDSVGDGVGDFRGLTAKLDYLEDLGVNTLWLLPFYPSPLRDDGYDIADYTTVNPIYGTLDDFKAFLNEAHRRGLRVITELVINHTSDQHPWFQRARRAPAGSVERDFYVWSDVPDKFSNVGLMFPDFETSNWAWDPVAKAYYWHRFYGHQPDLNYDNPAVWNAIFPVVDFWFGLGVDGMRLDAVPYLYEREGTTCEHLPETHGFLKALRKHIDDRFPDKMLLAEANAWPEEAVNYFGAGDECHMAFHFPLMPRLFMALHQEDRFPVLDMYAQTPPIPETSQWCLFLRNHDELTLAMVTDEERDYMYRAYMQDRRAKIFLGIRHRLAPLLLNDRRRIELMNVLLFSLPGSPVVYYGDEIGMGDNIYLGDRDGVRTPMQWSADRNAGFSRANPQKLYLPIIIDPEYHYEALNVEAHQNNPSSLLWWMKRLIALRKMHPAFGRGDISFLESNNPKVLAFVRRYQNERVLVVTNLSRFMQYAEIDLREFAGVRPEEMFGRSTLPPIGERPYPMPLGPHGYYWFELPAIDAAHSVAPPIALPIIAVPRDWQDLSEGTLREDLERLLPSFLNARNARPAELVAVRIESATPIRFAPLDVHLLFLRVEYRSGVPEQGVFPLIRVSGDLADRLLAARNEFVLAKLTGPPTSVLCDALAISEYAEGLLRAIQEARTVPLPEGDLVAILHAPFGSPGVHRDLSPVVRRSERNNFSIAYGPELMLKVFRRLDDDPNPDLEVSQFLAAGRRFAHAPAIIGHIDYRRRGRPTTTLAVLRQFVPNQGTAWQHALDQMSGTFERVAALSHETPPPPPTTVPLLGPAESALNETAAELFGGYLETARLIGQRTGELHAALAADAADPRFAPEPFDRGYQRSVYQSMRSSTAQVFDHLKGRLASLPEPAVRLATQLLPLRDRLIDEFGRVQDRDLRSQRIRCHSDFHLAQLLYTGNNFIVIDFEGDPKLSGGQRRIKRSPLRDVASMVLSWRYAAHSTLLGFTHPHGRPPGVIRPEDRGAISPWSECMLSWVAREYVAAYLELPGVADLMPDSTDSMLKLLELLMMDRSLNELEYDLRKRPDWAVIPLSFLLSRLNRV